MKKLLLILLLSPLWIWATSQDTLVVKGDVTDTVYVDSLPNFGGTVSSGTVYAERLQNDNN